MSVDVLHLAINFIESTESEQLQAQFRQELVPVSQSVAHLIEQLHLAYNGKPAKGYATFSNDLQDRMALPLAQWQAQERSFLQLAEQATSQLVVQLVQHQIQETGYFMLCHYRYLATEYVLVTLLGSKDHFSVTPELLLSTRSASGHSQDAIGSPYRFNRISNQPGAKQIHFLYSWPGRSQSRRLFP